MVIRARLPRLLALVAMLLALALSACTPARPQTPTPTPSVDVDYTRPGQAQRVLQALADASGQPAAIIKVELTRNTATIAVRDTGDIAVTWSWRDGKAQKVDGDTQYLGQTQFRLNEFDISDVGGLFRRAAAIADSATNQQLQIVEYSGTSVYMTVTTAPESQTVFFRPDGTLIPTLDFRTAAGIRQGIDDTVGIQASITSISITPATGVVVDVPSGSTGTLRFVRAAKYPTRTELRNTKPAYPLTFDPKLINPDVIARVIDQLAPDPKTAVSIYIDRRDQLLDPTIRYVVDGRTVVTDLAGNDITKTVKP